MQLHEPNTRVLCDTVNLTDRQVSELRQAHAQAIVTNDETLRLPSVEHMAYRKPFVMQRAMDRYPDEPWYGLLDADFLVRKPLGPLWSLLDAHPAALCITDGMWRGQFYRRLLVVSAIVIVRPDARKLVDCWAKWYYHDQPLDTIAPLEWLWDQITLAEAWTEANVPCAVIPMDVYGNEELGTGAAIWHANVPEKARYYQLFLNEYQSQSMESAQSK
jgi:hypothetical protein